MGDAGRRHPTGRSPAGEEEQGAWASYLPHTPSDPSPRARYARVEAQRSAAAAQIGRTIKAWRKAANSGDEEPEKEPDEKADGEAKEGEEEEAAPDEKAPPVAAKLREGVVHAMRADNPLRDQPLYHGPKPQYENPGHHQGGNPRKSSLPADAEQVYQRAVPSPDGQTWWGLSASGDIYRYQGSGGVVHWNGSESTGTRVPADIVRRLRR